jgi:hypothetical protein
MGGEWPVVGGGRKNTNPQRQQGLFVETVEPLLKPGVRMALAPHIN